LIGNNDENELIAQLASDKRSVKIQAIVKLTRVGKTELALKALLPLISSEDREISFFASQAATKISQKTGISAETLSNQPESATEASVIKKLSRNDFLRAPAEKAPELLAIIRNSPERIADEAIPAVGVFLNRHGDSSDAIFLERILLKENSNLALPLISAAEAIAPGILPRVLPNLLASSEPLVRSRSISALRKIDPEEAERHFSDLLSSRNPENRLAGISISFLFPFERVKGYILSMLPDESDSEVMTACQTVLASNPDVDTALSILDSIDAVSAEQKSRLSLIFKTVCQAIATAGILPAENAAPEMLIKLWKKQRLEAFLYDLEIQLAFAEEKKKQSIILWIEKNREHPKVEDLLTRLKQNPQTEDLVKHLSARKRPEKPAGINPSQSASTSINDLDKLEILKKLELESFKEHRAWIMAAAESGPTELRIESLNTLLKLHPQGKLIDLGKLAIEDGDASIRTAGFKILERLDPDFLKGKISSLLIENDPNLRVRAVRFGLKFKENECIEALRKLIRSNDQAVRSNAINCMAICPFQTIFPILMDQLDIEEHPVIARQIVSILLNNPSKQVLKSLDSITRTSNPAMAMVISQARNDLFDLVAQMPESEHKEPVKAEQDFSQTVSKPYSVSNVREIARKNQTWKPFYKATEEQKNKKASQTNWQMIISGAIVVMFFAMLPIMLLKEKKPSPEPREKASQDYRTSERVKPVSNNIPEKFRMNRPCSLSGVVEKIVSEQSLVMVHEGSQIMVKFDTPEVKGFSTGDQIEVTIVPYRVNPNGIILSKGHKIAATKGN